LAVVPLCCRKSYCDELKSINFLSTGTTEPTKSSKSISSGKDSVSSVTEEGSDIDFAIATSIAQTTNAAAAAITGTVESLKAFAASLSSPQQQNSLEFDGLEPVQLVGMSHLLQNCELGHYLTTFDVSLAV
jgi:hypothetical protein